MPESDDPFGQPDVTRVRPRPGAGRRRPGEGKWPGEAASGAPTAFTGAPRPAASSSTFAEPIPDEARALLGIGLNPLVRAASPLLLLAGQLRGAISPMDVSGLRGQALEEIRQFEELARAAGVQNEVTLAARYALCAGLDEAVLSTPWGAQSEWAQHPLLVALHREAWGGEKFFEMLDRIARDPARYIDLMELQYLMIAFGFAGKYEVQARGHERLADLQHGLYRQIRSHRGAPRPELSIRWRGEEDRRNPLIRYVPWWAVGAACLAILAITFTAYRASLRSAAAPLHAELAKVGLEDFSAPVAAPPTAGPTLRQLLAFDEQRGTLTVEEQGGRTTITLVARDLFASGSATVNPAHREALLRVADALNRVPGRVLIVGHTDDQPIKSLRFQDNFELSRERAVGVVDVLKPAIDNPARLSWTGAGSSQPRYRPESDPDNRSRNRRVEIVHVRGA